MKRFQVIYNVFLYQDLYLLVVYFLVLNWLNDLTAMRQWLFVDRFVSLCAIIFVFEINFTAGNSIVSASLSSSDEAIINLLIFSFYLLKYLLFWFFQLFNRFFQGSRWFSAFDGWFRFVLDASFSWCLCLARTSSIYQFGSS